MEEKHFKVKVIHKCETAADWERSSYVPSEGEIVTYKIDEQHNYERLKLGDGIHAVKDLPFVTDELDFILERPTEGLEYILSDDGTYYICDGGNVKGNIVIPSEYNGLPVKQISNSAFYGDRRGYRLLTSVVIPESIEHIDYNAFTAQWELEKIVLKGTPVYIDPYAFDTEAIAGYYGETAVACEVYVPWLEGQVEGAPWGADTIHYNSSLSKNAEEMMPIIGTQAILNASSIIPKSGQQVIYEPDENYTYYRYKTGDGITPLSDLAQLPLTALPSIQSLDETRFKTYTADYVNDDGEIVDFDGNPSVFTDEAEYYLNLNLYKAFKTKNRVYVERGNNSSGRWRGPYPMYTLSYDGTALKNPWLYKETWYKIYFNKAPGTFIYETAEDYIAAIVNGHEMPPPAPKASDFIGLDSIVQRTGDSEGALPGAAGHIRVPSRSIDDFDAMPEVTKNVAKEFAITRVYADSAITRNNNDVIVPFVENQIRYSIDNLTNQKQDEQIYVDSHNGVYSKITFTPENRALGNDQYYQGKIFRTYLTFDGETKGGSGIQFELWHNSSRIFQVLLGDGVIQTNYNHPGNDPDFSNSSFKKIVNVPELVGNGTILLEIIHNSNTDLKGWIGVRINGKLIVDCPPWGIGDITSLTVAATGGTTGKIYFTDTAFYDTYLDYFDNEPYAFNPVPSTTLNDCYDLSAIGIGPLPYSGSKIIVNGSYADTWQIIERDNDADIPNKEYVEAYVNNATKNLFDNDIKTGGKIELGKDASNEMDAVAFHQLQKTNTQLTNEVTRLTNYINNELKKVQTTCKDLIAYGGNLNGSDGLKYEIATDRSHAICTGETATGSVKKIATVYEGLPVTEIAASAFVNSTSDIYIPTTIKTVGSSAFNAPSAKLHIVDLESYMNIDFANSYATSPFTKVSSSNIYIENDNSGNLIIPEGITTVKMRAFQSNSTTPYIKSIKFPKSLTTIGTLAFSAIGVEELIIPATVTHIDAAAFEVAPKLISVIFEGTPISLSATTFQNSNAITDIYVPWSTGKIAGAPWGAKNATIHYDGKGLPVPGLIYELNEDGNSYSVVGTDETFNSTVFEIPEKYQGKPVTKITSRVFENNQIIKEVNLPDSIVEIGVSAFASSSLEKIKLPQNESLTMGYTVFSRSNLENITIPGSVGYVEPAMFDGCSNLKTAILEEGITGIGTDCFHGSALESIQLPETLNHISTYSLSNTMLARLNIPNGVTYIDPSAFTDTNSLTQIHCDWEQGEKPDVEAYSPWGAYNANVTYNSPSVDNSVKIEWSGYRPTTVTTDLGYVEEIENNYDSEYTETYISRNKFNEYIYFEGINNYIYQVDNGTYTQTRHEDVTEGTGGVQYFDDRWEVKINDLPATIYGYGAD